LAELWRYTADLMYLIENPIVREAFFPSQAQHLLVEPARREDKPAIDDIIERHENVEGAAALKRWWTALPGGFHAVRDVSGALCGFYCMFERGAVERLAPAYDDLVVRKWLDHGNANPAPSDQRTLLLRRWLAAEDGENPSAVQAACFLDIKRTYMELRPQLRRVYVAIRNAELWQSPLQKLRFQMLPDFDAEMDGTRYHAAILDFGSGSVDGWLSALAADELGVDQSDLLDAGARRLNLDGDHLALTRLDFQVFEFLMQRPGKAVSRNILRKAVWEHRGDGASNVVDAVVKSLRKKLGPQSSMIETVSGVGYRFCPERRLATLLFVDIVDSTERAVALGDARWRALLDAFYSEVSRVVASFEGRVVNTTGDGMLATFDTPAAALHSACTIRDAMAVHGVRTRAGVHTGECEAIGDDITGIAVHWAARIAAAAGAGEVLASGTVRDLIAGSGIVLSDHGLHHLKGIPGQHPLFVVDSAGAEKIPRMPIAGGAREVDRMRSDRRRASAIHFRRRCYSARWPLAL
jgi:class 3 adenylate cyclase